MAGPRQIYSIHNTLEFRKYLIYGYAHFPKA